MTRFQLRCSKELAVLLRKHKDELGDMVTNYPLLQKEVKHLKKELQQYQQQHTHSSGLETEIKQYQQ